MKSSSMKCQRRKENALIFCFDITHALWLEYASHFIEEKLKIHPRIVAAQIHTVLPDVSTDGVRLSGVNPHDKKWGWGTQWSVSTDSLLIDKTQKYWLLE